MTWWIWSKYMCLRLHVWWSIPVGRWTTNHQYYHTHTKHMYMNIFTKPSQYSLYYHRVNNSTDNQPVIHTLGNRDHSMDNLYISQHSTLNTQQSSYNHNSRSNTLYTHKENSKMTHNRHTHTRQDKTITHTQTLTVQHTIHYTLYRHSTSTVQVCHTHTGYHGQTHTSYRRKSHSKHPHYIITIPYSHTLTTPQKISYSCTSSIPNHTQVPTYSTVSPVLVDYFVAIILDNTIANVVYQPILSHRHAGRAKTHLNQSFL